MSEARETSGRSTLPEPPATAAVNSAWPARPTARRRWRRLLENAVERMLGPRFDAQREFNAAQVRLDNELLPYIDERLAATHRHYDHLLSELAHRLDEVDERHRLLEQELLRHVQDLVTRIDLILAEANRGKLALAFALDDARNRLGRLEEALRRK